MWLSNTVVLIQGLILVHVSMISCAWGGMRSFRYPSSPSGSDINDFDASIKYGGRRITNIRKNDNIERYIRGSKQSESADDQQSRNSAARKTDLMSKYNSIQTGFSTWRSYGNVEPDDAQQSRNYNEARTSASYMMTKFNVYYDGTKWVTKTNGLNSSGSFSASPSFSSQTPSTSPFSFSQQSTPSNTSPSYTPLTSPYTPSTPYYTPADPSPVSRIPSRTLSSRGLRSSLPSTDSSDQPRSGFSLGQSNAQQNLSSDKSTPSLFGSPQSSAFQRQPSFNSSAQTTSVEPVNNKQYKFAPDGRRLAGRQNETWPVMGNGTSRYDPPYDIRNAGNELGPIFEGILIPKMYIDKINAGLKKAKELSKTDEDGNGNENIFRPNINETANAYMDVELVSKAIREAQGIYDDECADPDPWTAESIYSDEVLDENMRAHNEYRIKHYAPNLTYMAEIHPVADAYAKYLAEEVARKGKDSFVHNSEILIQKGWSENLYTDESECDGLSPAKLVKKAIDGWYSEIYLYKYFGQTNANIEQPLTGHFTCLVWRGSLKMGLGMAKYRNTSRNKTTYVVVVNYDPRGNVPDEFGVNVIKEGDYKDRLDQLPTPKAPQQNASAQIGGLFGNIARANDVNPPSRLGGGGLGGLFGG